jgi:hypothetical protein
VYPHDGKDLTLPNTAESELYAYQASEKEERKSILAEYAKSIGIGAEAASNHAETPPIGVDIDRAKELRERYINHLQSELEALKANHELSEEMGTKGRADLAELENHMIEFEAFIMSLRQVKVSIDGDGKQIGRAHV